MSRIAKISRETSESKIELELNLDGSGKSEIAIFRPHVDRVFKALTD